MSNVKNTNLNSRTVANKISKSFYFEKLDGFDSNGVGVNYFSENVDGDCGGYNLHLAFTTGRIAGASAAEYLNR